VTNAAGAQDLTAISSDYIAYTDMLNKDIYL